jgi:hypothetical protein
MSTLSLGLAAPEGRAPAIGGLVDVAEPSGHIR